LRCRFIKRETAFLTKHLAAINLAFREGFIQVIECR
jgi:hypothetical protein